MIKKEAIRLHLPHDGACGACRTLPGTTAARQHTSGMGQSIREVSSEP